MTIKPMVRVEELKNSLLEEEHEAESALAHFFDW